ncbi:MAG TPA: membrane protein insertase YidC [Acidobacteriaceae bacterium]
MEKRLLLALVLAAIVIVVSQKLFPTPAAPRRVTADSTAVVSIADSVQKSSQSDSAKIPEPAPIAQSDTSVAHERGAAPIGDTLVISTSKAIYRFASLGAVPLDVVLKDYRVLPKSGKNIVLGRPGIRLLSYELATKTDTIHLDRLKFNVDSSMKSNEAGVTFTAAVNNKHITISYAFAPDGYLANVHGSVIGADPSTDLLIRLHQGLPIVEADSSDDLRSLAYVVKPVQDGVSSVSFSKLDSLAPKIEPEPLAWVASKNKYFLLAIISKAPGQAFSAAVFTRGLHQPKAVAAADGLLIQPLTKSGEFAFQLYTGPQEWRRLHQMGQDLDHVNLYGGILRAVVEPFANVVMQILLWIHDGLRTNYGWVLIIFGVTVRILLWPLNQGAMRNSLKLQRIQPQLQEIQKRYKSQPEKLQTEMGKLYRDHGMSPFTPLAGCLPMLIPMPVLYALYFVFQNSIEFRGVSFLWLPDLSQRDPFFILPAAMGISMFVLSWISLRASPPNPQAKMMAYVFPVMMVVFFWRLAAGLNLYYAVQNIATLPQQWLIARERAKLTVTPASG